MKLSLTVNCWVDEDLMFAQQFGANHVVAEAVLPASGGTWDTRTLTALRNRVEKAGLKLVGVDRLLQPLDRAILGASGRDAEIEAACRLVGNAGTAGIPLLGYEWTLSENRPPERNPEGRGGAGIASSAGIASPAPAQMWDRLMYFLERVVPVAEKAGVRLAYRAGDACSTESAGPNSVEALKRLVETVPGSYHGLDFCPATMAETPGEDVVEAARFFGLSKKIFMVTVRNLRKKTSAFTEAFLDEGDIDMLEALLACRETGFYGPLRPGRQPAMTDDTAWGHKAQAFAAGYLRALLQALERDPETC